MAGADAVVIGGGAAGIAAARALHDAGRDVLLIEAKDRLGGRAQSMRLELPGTASANSSLSATAANAGVSSRADALHTRDEMPVLAGMTGLEVTSAGTTDAATAKAGVIVDLGCGWLHSARRNPWSHLAERYGFTVDRSDPGWGRQWRDLGFSPDEQRAFGAASERLDQATHAALAGPDRALGSLVPAGEPWRPLLDAISGYVNGARLDAVSLHDWAAYEDAAIDDNWAVEQGYGTLVAHHAAGVPVRLGVRATRIDHRGRTIRIDTDAGTIETRHVIVAVPTTALVTGALRFDPPLPAKQTAAAALPLGIADKLFLTVDGPAFPASAHLLGNPHSACTGSYRLAPFGAPIVEVFLGGDCAEAIEREDDRGAYAFAIGELTALLGREWRFVPLARTRWRHDPDIGGSYSHARIGHAGARAVLAAPVDERLFFAGEACSYSDFSTAHGAYATGIAAADAVLAALGASATPGR